MAVESDLIVDLSDNDDDCVMLSVKQDSNNKHNVFDNIFNENPLMAEVIEKCFNLENSQGMYRVLNNSLLRVYKEADPSFKSSPKFETILKKFMTRLDQCPHKKFSHIKDLCETLKSRKFKKHVQLITLEKKLNRKIRNKINKQKSDIIDLDKYEEIPIINLVQSDLINDSPIVIDDEKENDSSQENCIMEVDGTNDYIQNENYTNIVNLENENDVLNIKNSENIYILPENIDTEKQEIHKTNDYIQNENYTNIVNLENENEMLNIKNSENIYILPENVDTEKQNQINENEESFPLSNDLLMLSESHTSKRSPEKLLVPHIVVLSMDEEPTTNVDIEKIKEIEQQIAEYKEQIKKLDEEEVTDDSVNSPYIKSEKFKEKIVALYKELCSKTGSETTKRYGVRLSVKDGHPKGPVRILEKFLNKNIDSNGNPPFPDFNYVVKCVESSNIRDNLGWNKNQVMREAIALFTHCGRALQKRRQRREWHDLLSRVKEEECSIDPADSDAELLARLEANKRIAVKNEADLLERYSMMEKMSPPQMNRDQIQTSQADEVVCMEANSGGISKDSLQVNLNNDDRTIPPIMNISEQLNGNATFNGNDPDSHINDLNLNKEHVTTSHCSLVQNMGPVIAHITPGSMTNKTYTNEFGLIVNCLNPIPYVNVNTENNIALNFESHDSEVYFKAKSNVSNARICFEENNFDCDFDEHSETNVPTLKVEEVNLKFEENNFQSNTNFECKKNIDGESYSEFNTNNTKEPCFLESSFNCKVDENSEVDVARQSDYDDNVKIEEDESFIENVHTTSKETDCSDINTELDEVTIKEEPTESIAKLLNDFSDNYTVSIFDIEDPFLVVEISDSSDED